MRIFETFESEEMLHIVMDFAAGGDLATVLRSQSRTTLCFATPRN